MPIVGSDRNVCNNYRGVGAKVVMNDPFAIVFMEWVVAVMYANICHNFRANCGRT